MSSVSVRRPIGLLCLLLLHINAILASRLAESSYTTRELKAVAKPVIVGGQVVKDNRFPYAAIIFDKERPYCSGALIHPQVVLTAAHCAESEYIGVKIGTRNWMLDDIYGRLYYARMVPKAIQHPDFKLNQDRIFADMLGDLALMILSSPLPGNSTLLKLPSPNLKVPTKLEAVGYGTTSEGGTSMSSDLRSVALNLIGRADCNKLLNKINPKSYNVTDAVVCAGYMPGGKDTCQGDSGGPLIIKGKTAKEDVLIGIVSFGEGCARKNVPAGYTNVRMYVDWVQKTLKKLVKAGTIVDFKLP